MKVVGVVLVVAGALASYVAVCWVLAFLRNMLRELLRRAIAWCARRLAWRRGWRDFVAEYREDFAGPEFRWPAAVSAPGSGPAGGAR